MIFYVFKLYNVVCQYFDLVFMKAFKFLSLLLNVKNSDLNTLKK